MKKKILYLCQQCGAVHTKWVGKCSECGQWNSLASEMVDDNKLYKQVAKASATSSLEIYGIVEISGAMLRNTSGISEFDRVLGGGLVKGAGILIAGEPGIGKSTLLLQLSASLGQHDVDCLYISGEESGEQIKVRAERLGLGKSNIKIATTNNLLDILPNLSKLKAPAVLIVDSIQTLYSPLIDSSPGTVTQVKNCAFELLKISKQRGITLVLVGHVTKEGQIAGPKVLEHMVDTVVYFEGDHIQQFRIIRAIKNRYGPAGEVGIFEMSSAGLQEMTNPSAIFMPLCDMQVSGSCIFASLEGNRPVLVEIQALVVPSFLATPRRSAVGWDTSRFSMIIAILNARFGLNLLNKEVYLNVVGGLKITEPAADLAVLMALVSAAKNIPLPHNMVFFGEIGLSGELRQVTQYENRLNEAMKLGMQTAVMPHEHKKIACNLHRIWLKHITDIHKLLTTIGGSV